MKNMKSIKEMSLLEFKEHIFDAEKNAEKLWQNAPLDLRKSIGQTIENLFEECDLCAQYAIDIAATARDSCDGDEEYFLDVFKETFYDTLKARNVISAYDKE